MRPIAGRKIVSDEQDLWFFGRMAASYNEDMETYLCP